jgi:ribonuclease HI
MRDVTKDGWVLFFDGLCEPKNPGGIMSWGWSIHRPGEPNVTGSAAECADPKNTNNIAEYYALAYGIKGVQALIDAGASCHNLLICGDSNLVVKQMVGAWGSKTPHLTKLRDRCIDLLDKTNVHWLAEWIPRENNGEADELSRAAYLSLAGTPPPERVQKPKVA